jgi:hypothetical protein
MEDKVVCPQCQTEGKKSKVILYPGQITPKLKFTDGYWNEDELITGLCRAVEDAEGMLDKEATNHDDLFDAFRIL